MRNRIATFLAVTVGLGFGAGSAPAQGIECSADTLNSCPGACIERCINDDAFFTSNEAACGRLARDVQRNPSIADTSSCTPVATAAGSAFGACLMEARAIEREDTGRAELEEILSTAPTCGQTTFALRQMYVCLSNETDTIRSLFEPLAGRGYGTGDDQVTGPDNRVCQIPRNQIDTDELMADSLTTQSQILMAEFAVVSACRQEWEVWLNSASALDLTSETGAVQQGIATVITAMQSEIAPAAAREVEISGIIDDIGRQLEQILGVIFVRNLICPPESP